MFSGSAAGCYLTEANVTGPRRWIGSLRLLCEAYIKGPSSGELIAPTADQTAADMPFPNLVVLLETTVLLKDARIAAAAAQRLAPFARFPTGYAVTCLARQLGRAAAMLGRPHEARDYYVQAIDVCERMRAHAELALAHLDLAQLFIDNDPEKRQAASHLDFSMPQ